MSPRRELGRTLSRTVQDLPLPRIIEKLRYNYLFRSTKGLVLVAIALISLTTALFGMLSGPMEEFGVKGVVVRTLGIRLVPAEREGRIILIYHTIASPNVGFRCVREK